jgi:hypothetical protein
VKEVGAESVSLTTKSEAIPEMKTLMV